jgi:hypothetical protein
MFWVRKATQRHTSTMVCRRMGHANGFFLLFLTSCGLVNGLTDVPLRNSKYNYLLDYMFDGKAYTGIVDTGSHLILPMVSDSENVQGSCISRLIDGTLMNFSSSSASCREVSGNLQIGGATAQLNVSFAIEQYLANPALHSWSEQTGVFGLNYSPDAGTVTSFEALLLEVSTTTLFGLDLNPVDSSSSLQLGGVSEIYADSLIWSPAQPSSALEDHTFYLHDLELCGNPLMANWSNNWPVVVDTASVCLTLPSEYYHLFLAWFNVTIARTSSVVDLPALSFSLSPNSDSRLSISLTDLLINSSDIHTEIAPHLITIPSLSQELSLCVLEGSQIDNSKSSDLAVPPIVFGSLTLRSLYFASDMRSQRIAFASKHFTEESSSSGAAQCLPPKQCHGESNLDRDYNVCMKPDCSRYFYVAFNHDTGMCEYNNGAFVVGLLFITVIACLEVLTFFTTQYTFLEHSYYTSLRFKPDPVTHMVGSYLVSVFDFLRVSVFGWSSDEGTVVGHTELNDGEVEEGEEDEEQQPQARRNVARREESL